MQVYFEQQDIRTWLVWLSMNLVGKCQYGRPIGTIVERDGGFTSRRPAGLHANEMNHRSLDEAQQRFLEGE